MTPNNDVLPPKAVEKLKSFPLLKKFILWVLVRDPDRRPKVDELRLKFEEVRQNISEPAQNVDRFTSVTDRFRGLWAISGGVSTHPVIRWPISPTVPDPPSLSTFFQATIPSSQMFKSIDKKFACTISGWRQYPMNTVPAFVSSSGLDGLILGDVNTLLGASLSNSNICAVIFCTRDLNCINEDGLGHHILETQRKQAEQQSNLITHFRQVTSLAGIETHVTSLPCVTSYGDDVQKQFSSAINLAMNFARRALFLAGVGPCVANNFANVNRSRVLLVSMSDDVSAALTIAASIHACVHEGGVRAATVAFSPAVTLEASWATLYPTDIARLAAWEARVRASAALVCSRRRFCCPNGCWSVTLKGSSSLSPNKLTCHTHPCSGTCDDGCPGLHLGIERACAGIRTSLSTQTKYDRDDKARGDHKLWWAYTTAEMLEPDALSAFALAEEDASIMADKISKIHLNRSVIGKFALHSEGKVEELNIEAPRDCASWQLYVCSACRHATHAVAKGESGASRRVAIIINPTVLMGMSVSGA